MRPEDEAQSRWSNVLWNVLGGHDEGKITIEVRRADLQQHDTVLLCSDGLYRHLSETEIVQVVVGRFGEVSDAPLASVEKNLPLRDVLDGAERDPGEEDTKPDGIQLVN